MGTQGIVSNYPDSDLIPSNIRSGVNIFEVEGDYSGTGAGNIIGGNTIIIESGTVGSPSAGATYNLFEKTCLIDGQIRFTIGFNTSYVNGTYNLYKNGLLIETASIYPGGHSYDLDLLSGDIVRFELILPNAGFKEWFVSFDYDTIRLDAFFS